MLAHTSTSRVPFLYSALICDGSTLSGSRSWRRAKADERSERCTLDAHAPWSARARDRANSDQHTPLHSAFVIRPSECAELRCSQPRKSISVSPLADLNPVPMIGSEVQVEGPGMMVLQVSLADRKTCVRHVM